MKIDTRYEADQSRTKLHTASPWLLCKDNFQHIVMLKQNKAKLTTSWQQFEANLQWNWAQVDTSWVPKARKTKHKQKRKGRHK